MTSKVAENDLELHAIGRLKDLGYEYLHGSQLRPDIDSGAPERSSYRDVILRGRLKEALGRINVGAPAVALEEAIKRITNTVFPELFRENERIHSLLVNGVQVDFDDDGERKSERVHYIDWDNLQNDWLVTNQLEIVGSDNRRFDVDIYLNGLPVVVAELKAPENPEVGIHEAFNQIKTYQEKIPDLFRTNLLNVISDGFTARYGSLTADFERYGRWRSVDGINLIRETEGLAVDTLIDGLLQQDHLLRMLQRYVVFENTGQVLIKKVAAYHQFFGSEKGLESIRKAMLGSAGQGGVFWHTQGSGKSLLMAFLAGVVIHDPEMKNPTIVVITDRSDLDSQLLKTFQGCADLFGQKPDAIETMAELRTKLDVKQGGIFFSTIQKFQPMDGEQEFPLLSDRSNVIVFVDEAHRTQYGLDGEIDKDTGGMKYGFAHCLRVGLPNATYVGFTGTPIELGDRNTTAVFGNYIDKYDLTAAVEDEITVPIYFEARVVKMAMTKDDEAELSAEFERIMEGATDEDERKLGKKWARQEALLGTDDRLNQIVDDFIKHSSARFAALGGKVMFVCSSRRICSLLYEKIVERMPEWHGDDDQSGEIKVVITGSASDPEFIQRHVRGKQRNEVIASRFKNPDDPLKVVIVRNMWLTGFDVPVLHTLYVDKAMQGHDLMQTITRVNRVFRGKESGLIVDYIGIASQLKDAVFQYSESDRDKVGVDAKKAEAELIRRYEASMRDFKMLEVGKIIQASPGARMQLIARSIENIYRLDQHKEIDVEADRSGKNDTLPMRQRFLDASLGLYKAWQLASGSATATSVEGEVIAFMAIRTAMNKIERDDEDRVPLPQLEEAMKRLLDSSVETVEIIDIQKMTGMTQSDISILSDQFLDEVRNSEYKNLAIEALRKLLADEIRSRPGIGIVQERDYGDRLKDAITRYHNRAISSLEVLEELLSLAKKIQEQPDDGLSLDERKFYQALATNTDVSQLMGDDRLKLLAGELVKEIQEKSTRDWWKWDNSRSGIRLAVKKLLKRFGYPPEFAQDTVALVVKQAEQISIEISKSK